MKHGDTTCTRSCLVAGLLLGAAGFAANTAPLPLFLNIHLYFGSIFVIFALLRWGATAGVIAAAVAGLYTAFAWHHPWMLVIQVAEALFLARCLRRSRNILLLDTAFWLLLGMPLTLLSQTVLLDAPSSLAMLLTLKFGVNGIFITLLAAVLSYILTLLRRSHVPADHLPTMHHLLVTVMVAAIMIPGISYVILDIRRDVEKEEILIRQRLVSASELSHDLVKSWLRDKIHDVEILATLVGDPQTESAGSIQAAAEQVKLVSPHFLTMSVQNNEAVSVAFVPRINDQGVSNVGRDYSKMPYHSMLRETQRPVVSDVDFGTVNRGPRVALFAPIVREGYFRGYCTGVIEIGWLKNQLAIISADTGADITLLDRKQQVISSTDVNLKTMERLDPRGGGDFRWLREKVYQVVPKMANVSEVRRWQRGSFGMDSVIDGDVPWTVAVRAPMKPFLTVIYHNGSRGFVLLLVLTAFSICAAQAASAAFVRPVARLERVSAVLPTELVRHDELDWPNSGIREVAGLIGNIRTMAGTLNGYVFELQTLNESLEQRVADRTEELQRSEERFRAIFTDAGIGIVVGDSERRIIDCNPAMERLLGFSRKELIGKFIADISDPHDEMANIDLIEQAQAHGGQPFSMEKRYICKDGSTLWGNLTVSFIRSSDDQSEYTIGMVEDISDRKNAEEEVRQLAYFDPLTRLPNRALFHDRLGQALARGAREDTGVALLFLDLDRFKDVNDTMGHASGDLLLASVAKRLKTAVRKSDTLARIGGDEFVVILNGITDDSSVTVAAQHILDRMNEPFDLDGTEVFITTSIGIVMYPGDGADAESLLKHADMALYAAKGTGRNAFNFFSQEMNKKATHRKKMEDALRHALANREFFLVYQPLVDIRSGKAFGVEALLRWNSPNGIIDPGSFVPIAEETGMIRRIGEWVFRTACHQCRGWQDRGLPPLQVAVNVSGSQFNEPGFMAMIDKVLAETGVNPKLVELELTETTLMEGRSDTVHTLSQLKARGIRLAIDDFGTGYSSLSYLKHFPIDRIKIDRSFVSDIVHTPDDRAIVEAIIAMAHSLGLRVLAEGVERQEELDLLRERGCDEAQGYWFGRGMAPKEIESLVKEQGMTPPASVIGITAA